MAGPIPDFLRGRRTGQQLPPTAPPGNIPSLPRPNIPRLPGPFPNDFPGQNPPPPPSSIPRLPPASIPAPRGPFPNDFPMPSPSGGGGRETFEEIRERLLQQLRSQGRTDEEIFGPGRVPPGLPPRPSINPGPITGTGQFPTFAPQGSQNPFLSGAAGNNPLLEGLADEIFGADPELAFLTELQRRGLPLSQERFLRTQLPRIFDIFRSQAGSQLAGGQLPNQEFFRDFLPNFNLQNFQGQFSPTARGLGTQRFTGPTRFNF